jgi:hypothetical protein
VVAYLAGTPGYSPSWERIWRIASIAAIVLTVAAFVQMFLRLRVTG